MTDVLETPVTTQTDSSLRRLMFRLGGGSLIAGSALFLAGAFTSPDQSSDSLSDYIVSLGRDPMLTQLSALFLHYGNLLIGAAAVLLPFLVRGRRGRGITLAGALMMALGFLNTSGAVLSDWWHMRAARQLPIEQATALGSSVLDSPLLGFWTGVQNIGLLGVIVALAGLARAGVIRWWLVPAPVVCFVAAFLIPLSLPMIIAAVVGLAFAPLAWAGVIAVRRARLG